MLKQLPVEFAVAAIGEVAVIQERLCHGDHLLLGREEIVGGHQPGIFSR